jgi:phosphoribosylformylglycinamidine synthase
MKARVHIRFKPAVLDPQGQAVSRTLRRLGFDEVSEVRVGKLVEIALEASDPALARARVETMCKTLIANTVIEDFDIEIQDE